MHGDRLERSARRRHVGIREATDDEVARRARYGEWTVEVPRVLWCGAGEVELDLVALDRHGNADLELALGRLEHVARLPAPVRKRGERGAHPALGVGVELVHGRRDR